MLFKRKKIVDIAPVGIIPSHIAIIMDGNGRWGSGRGLPRSAGHAAGAEAFRRAAEHLNKLGVKYLTVYAFSTENWKRPGEEVSAIMSLLEKYLREAIRDMEKNNIRLGFFGDTLSLPESLRSLIDETRLISHKTDGLLVNVCLNYGSRTELTRAARRLAEECRQGLISPSDIDERALSDRLYSAGIPDPDLVIRTGAEKRISNFLLWQCAYSEFYFTDTLWPDMDETELNRAIDEFNRRQRRFGGI